MPSVIAEHGVVNAVEDRAGRSTSPRDAPDRRRRVGFFGQGTLRTGRFAMWGILR